MNADLSQDPGIHVPLIVRLNEEWKKNQAIGPRPVFNPHPPFYERPFEPSWWQQFRFRLLGTWGEP